MTNLSEYGLDNRYYNYGCPAIMKDGRFITSYVNRRQFDQSIRLVNKINSAQDFKNFLQNNGDTILNNQRAILQKVYTCGVSGKCVSLDGKFNCDSFCGCK
jgi:hypothetical protein